MAFRTKIINNNNNNNYKLLDKDKLDDTRFNKIQ